MRSVPAANLTATVALVGGRADEPSRVTAIDSDAFRVVAAALADAATEPTAVAPFLLIGATDSRNYGPALAAEASVIRWQPIAATLADVARVHGVGERVTVAAWEGAVRAYVAVMQRAAGG